jgi:hypothetical protein
METVLARDFTVRYNGDGAFKITKFPDDLVGVEVPAVFVEVEVLERVAAWAWNCALSGAGNDRKS